jgi:LPXTG-site transpeptidase (sortase) family protein
MRRRRRRLLRLGELTFLLAGISALAFFGAASVHSTIFQLEAEKQFEKLSGKDTAAFGPHRWHEDPSLPIGRLEIPAIGLKVMVLQGTDAWTLNGAVGHISGTAFPGEPGNVGLAGHRDSFFRGLKGIALNDPIILRTPIKTYHYKVENISIVTPNDTHVLMPIAYPNLTLVTCYPFYFVGKAPERFIVRARLMGVS